MNIYKTIALTALSLGFLFTSLHAQSNEPEPVSMAQALELAAESDKKILIDVYAAWCPYCQRMHSNVYKDDEVLTAIGDHFVWVKINVESDNKVNFNGTEMTEAQFARALDNENVPTTYFMDRQGAIIGAQPGFIEADMFATLLNFVGSDAYLSQTFQEFQNR